MKLADELWLVINANISPMQTIKAMTVATDLLDHENNLGRIEAGRLADIFAVLGNPL